MDTEEVSSDSGGEGCLIFYSELTEGAILVTKTEGAILITKTEVEETQFKIIPR